MQKIIRLRKVLELTGYARSSFYARVKAKLITRPVKISRRAVGWPINEIEAILDAVIRGENEERIICLVEELEAARCVNLNIGEPVATTHAGV